MTAATDFDSEEPTSPSARETLEEITEERWIRLSESNPFPKQEFVEATGVEGDCLGCGNEIAPGEALTASTEGYAHEVCPEIGVGHG